MTEDVQEFKAPHERLKYLRMQRGYKSAAKFARINNLPEPTYRAHENGARTLTAPAAQKYAQILSASWHWLLFGSTLPAPTETTLNNQMQSSQPIFKALGEKTIIPIIAGSSPIIELGNSHNAKSPHVLKEINSADIPWYFPNKYITQILRIPTKSLRIIEVMGDMMEPTLKAGDRIMINVDDTRPSPPGIFSLWDGITIAFSRIEIIHNTNPIQLTMKYDNTFYPEYKCLRDEVQLLGRVVWVCKTL